MLTILAHPEINNMNISDTMEIILLNLSILAPFLEFFEFSLSAMHFGYTVTSFTLFFIRLVLLYNYSIERGSKGTFHIKK